MLTKTKNSRWKITVMSLRQTEVVDSFRTEAEFVAAIRRVMKGYEWEQLTDD